MKLPEQTDRLEREVAAAFTDVLAPQPGDEAKLDAMIGLALRQPPSGPPPNTGARLWPRLVGAGGLVLAAVALLSRPDTPTPQTLAGLAADPPAALAPPVVRPPADAPAIAMITDLPPADPPPERPSRPVRARPELSAPPPAELPDELADPDALLRAANQARRARRYAEADGLYSDLQARFPDSRAARTSRVPHARLLLDTLARPADALDGFSAYLTTDPRGTLSEEALVGQAQALRALGRLADAREAWRSLLARFPESVHAPAAQRQIAEAGP